jgi:hypothetical protein
LMSRLDDLDRVMHHLHHEQHTLLQRVVGGDNAEGGRALPDGTSKRP